MSWERDKKNFHMSPQCCRKTVPTSNSDFRPLYIFFFNLQVFIFFFFFFFFFENNQIFIFEINDSMTVELHLFACHNMCI